MIKKKAKARNKPRKTTKRRSNQKSKQELHPAEIRKEIAAMVEAEAGKLAGAVIEEGKKGQLPTVKYLFEVAHIFPEAAAETDVSKEEDSLAKTLLDRMNIPDEPVIHDLYERGEDVVVIEPRPRNDAPSGSEEKKEEELVGAE